VSQIPTSPPVKAEVKIGEVLGMVATMPAAVQGAMSIGLLDVLSHHRLSVIKAAGLWPGKRRAQAMIASRLHRYTRQDENDAGVSGQAFAAAQKGETFGGSAFKRFEEGAAVSSSDPFVVPIGAGRAMVESGIKGRRQQFRDLIGSDRVHLIRSASGKVLVVRTLKGRGRRQKGLRSELLGVLSRRRFEPPRLKYRQTFDEVVAKDLPKLEKVVELGTTVAGRQRLRRADALRAVGQAAYTREFRNYLTSNPRKFVEARRAALEAKRLARGQVHSGGRA
jgi:hypothetical protein